MSRFKPRRPSPAMVVAIIALFVALAGTATAAKMISGKSIKNNTISSTDIKNNSVKSTDVKNGSLLKKDFKKSQLPAGPQGPAGRAGQNGTGTLTYRGTSKTVQDGGFESAHALCPAGSYPTGGDAVVASGSGPVLLLHAQPFMTQFFSFGDDDRPNGWVAIDSRVDTNDDVEATDGPDGRFDVSVSCTTATRPPTSGPGKRISELRRALARKQER